MTRLLRALLIGLLLGMFTPALPHASGSGQTVHVKGYTKKDGTVVAPYDRSAPHAKGSPPAPAASAPASTTPATTSTTAHPASYCETCARDAKGKILRGEAAKRAFERMTGFPTGRRGYVIDHIIALACGGQDVTANMQWQTIADAKAKDKVERRGCTQ